MNEFQIMLTDILQLVQFSDFFNFLVPYAGVGGGVEAKEYVSLGQVIRNTLTFLAAIASLFGIALALAAKKFSVTIDPKVEEVKEVLAHAH
jgi:hypothetical protein